MVALMAMPIACVLAGILKYLVFDPEVFLVTSLFACLSSILVFAAQMLIRSSADPHSGLFAATSDCYRSAPPL
ncbi:hypothetical protein JJC00_24980 [Bradyrhizobium diazoefficiens]|uniref:hypothetical protein n=1 Tax=Bradyrhizobium diazoefficiens TaxID=1355477 RepID=UPI001909B3B9|nr:hypothetical protein [Bradyrhizobium diazoefficiens]QQO37924.1 hypothetical protein JJC00_24980 [Bradyrhizobium diazoefficiens]